MSSSKKVYAVDLDSTLAYHTDWVHHTKIGAPIPAMRAKVLQWLNDGHEVFIFSARLNAEEDIVEDIRYAIQEWCVTHIGYMLPITGKKLLSFSEIYDDRAIQVVKNDGRTHIEFILDEFQEAHKDDLWVAKALRTLRTIHTGIQNAT